MSRLLYVRRPGPAIIAQCVLKALSVLIVVLTGCQPATATPSPTFPPPPISRWPSATTAPQTFSPEATPTAAPATLSLRLWTLPEFAPQSSLPGGALLEEQLIAFAQANGGVNVDVRIKAAEGRGGMLDSLRATAAVAPSALPDVVALRRPDLLAAAAERLIVPLDAHLAGADLSDYYPFALEAARADGVPMGIPFAADATALAYGILPYPTPPISWTDVISGTGPLVFPAGDPLARLTVQQYLALGGSLADAAGRPSLDPGLLTQVLGFFRTAREAGVLPLSVNDMSDFTQSWTVYRERRAVLAVAHASDILGDFSRVSNTAITLIPTRDGRPLTQATGWSYALVTADPVRQSPALALMDWLTAPERLGPWTAAAHHLPPRSRALALWPADQPSAYVSQILANAVLEPDVTLLAVVGPPLKQAATDVIAGRASPEAAAQQAVAALSTP